MAIKDIYKNMGMPKSTVKSVAKMEKKPLTGPVGAMPSKPVKPAGAAGKAVAQIRSTMAPKAGVAAGLNRPSMAGAGGLMGAGVKPKSPVKPTMPAKSSGTRSVAPVRPIAPKPSMPGRAAASVAAPKAVAKMSKKK